MAQEEPAAGVALAELAMDDPPTTLLPHMPPPALGAPWLPVALPAPAMGGVAEAGVRGGRLTWCSCCCSLDSIWNCSSSSSLVTYGGEGGGRGKGIRLEGWKERKEGTWDRGEDCGCRVWKGC